MHSSEDIERKPRFALDPTSRRSSGPRATSQPARNDLGGPASPLQSSGEVNPPSAGHITGNGVWGSPLRTEVGEATWAPRAIPIRSASFSVSDTHPHHDTSGRMSFPSTFEDDEEEELGDEEATRASDHNPTPNGAFSRSRSQSMANEALRSHVLALPLPGSSGLARNWGDRDLDNYGTFDFNQSGVRRPSVSPVRRSRMSRDIDLSNMSPFVRDVSQILNDEPAPIREPWVTLGGPGNWREDNGGGSGTTSRRHSVSIVQPRRAVAGFVIPGEVDRNTVEDDFREREHNGASMGTFGSGALRISDEDLISGLNSLNLHKPPSVVNRGNAPSQPSSLPTYPPYGTFGDSPRALYGSDVSSSGLSTSMGRPQSRSPARGYLGRTTSFGSPSNEAYAANGFTHMSGHARDQNGSFLREDVIGLALPRSQIGMPIRSFQAPPRESSLEFAPSSPVDYTLPAMPTLYQPGLSSTIAGLPRIQTSITPTTGRSPMSPGTTSFPRLGHQSQYSQGSIHAHRNQHDPTSPTLSDLGKGVPLHAVPDSDHLYIVEFKAGRTDIFYCPDRSLSIGTGDLVIVEADRGKDLGKVVNDSITLADVEFFLKQTGDPTRAPQIASPGTRDAYLYAALSGPLSSSSAGPPMSPTVPGATKPVKDIMPKRIYSKAQPQETQLLISKMQDEAKALQLCQNKVRQKRLPMQVVDAEFQWDRRKLTFYFTADKRIDFRELVRELFRLYKTRIWMACLGENIGEYTA